MQSIAALERHTIVCVYSVYSICCCRLAAARRFCDGAAAAAAVLCVVVLVLIDVRAYNTTCFLLSIQVQ